MAAFGGRCSECGVETPADLRILRGGISQGHLSKRDLLINVVARLVVGGLMLVVALAVSAYVIHLLRTATQLTVNGVSLGVFLVAVLNGAALFILYKVPRRFRALVTAERTPVTAQWAWTELGLWTDTTAYPERSQSWETIDSVKVTARAGWVSVLLQGKATLLSIAFLGSEDDAKSVRAEFEKHIADAKARATAKGV